MVSMLITAKGADVNPRDIDGESPLSLACSRGAWRSARILLSAGGDPCSHGRYPSCLARAIDGGSAEISKMILKSHPECAQEPEAVVAGIRAGTRMCSQQ